MYRSKGVGAIKVESLKGLELGIKDVYGNQYIYDCRVMDGALHEENAGILIENQKMGLRISSL